MLVASRTNHALFPTALLVIIFGLLSACSRENPLSTPEPYIEPEIPFCTDESPFSFELLSRVDFTNINSDLTVVSDTFTTEAPAEGEETANTVSENNRKIVYSATAPYLSNATTITPIPLTDYKRNELGEVIFDDENNPTIILVNKEVTRDILENLSEEDIEELENFVPEIVSISYSIDFSLNGVDTSEAFDEELSALNTNLQEGENNFTIKIKASVVVPKTGLECTDTQSDLSRVVNLDYEQHYTISRNFLSDFTATTLDTTGLQIRQNDELGNVIAVNDHFLVLGVPNEASDFQGIRSIDVANQTTTAALSGAAFVFMKDSNNLWAPHSIIKSSNSQAGDRFGSAITLYESTMAISAPGEDSNASGIHSNDNSNTQVLKINNTATNSGAVYIFSFNEETNSWQESFYIKPNNNVVSDGSFNKRFGERLLLTDNLLLISAPGEDSYNGDADDSSVPDSGIVYRYAQQDSPLSFSFLDGVKAFNPGAGDLFGSSLAVNEKFIAIGAPFEDNDKRLIINNLETASNLDQVENNNRSNSGAVYVFSRINNSTAIERYSYIKSSNSDAEDFFGASLAFGNSSLIVGAPGEDSIGSGLNRDMSSNASTDSGAVYFFSLNQNANIWFETNYLKAEDNQVNSAFGQFIGFDKNNLVVSSPNFDDTLLNNAGKVYLYEYKEGAITYNEDFIAIGNTENMQLGKKLVIKNRHLVMGASGFTDSTTGNDIPLMGKVISYQ